MNLPTIKIEINGVTYENSFAQDVRIDRTNLDEEFATQPEKYAYYAFLAEEAKHVYEYEKFSLEQIYAVVDFEKRMAAQAAQAQNPKFKYTETMVENEVITDKRYTAQKEKMLQARLLSGQLQQAAIAIAQRRDMLQQLGAHTRAGTMPTRVVESKHDHVRDIIRESREQREPAIDVPSLPPPEDGNAGPERRSRRKPKTAE